MRNDGSGFRYPSRLIGWVWGTGFLFVAVHSYLDVPMNDEESIELAIDYLSETGWTMAKPDFVL